MKGKRKGRVTVTYFWCQYESRYLHYKLSMVSLSNLCPIQMYGFLWLQFFVHTAVTHQPEPQENGGFCQQKILVLWIHLHANPRKQSIRKQAFYNAKCSKEMLSGNVKMFGEPVPAWSTQAGCRDRGAVPAAAPVLPTPLKSRWAAGTGNVPRHQQKWKRNIFLKNRSTIISKDHA